MSDIRVDTISAANGTDPVTLTKQSAAKVFERHNSSHTIVSSFNVSALTDNGSGDTTVSYTNAFAAADQIITASAGDEDSSHRVVSSVQSASSQSTSHRYQIVNSAFTLSNCPVNCSIAHGDLA